MWIFLRVKRELNDYKIQDVFLYNKVWTYEEDREDEHESGKPDTGAYYISSASNTLRLR